MYRGRYRVALTRLGFNEQGAQLIQLQISKDASIADHQGKLHDLAGAIQLHNFPFLYWQSKDGRIVSVHHHPRESDKALAVKRQLASMHQFVLPDDDNGNADDRLQWETAREMDAHGPAAASYLTKRGLLGRRLYRKSALWSEGTADRPAGLVNTQGNTTAIVDHRTGVVHRLDCSVLVYVVDTKVKEKAERDGIAIAPHTPSTKQVNLPTQPTTTVWTRVATTASRTARRRLFGTERHVAPDDRLEPPDGFVTAALHHVATADEKRREKALKAKKAREGIVKRERQRLIDRNSKLEDDNVEEIEELYQMLDSEKEELNCHGNWARAHAAEIVTCLYTSRDRDKTRTCLSQLGSLHLACDNLELPERLERALLSERCAGYKSCGAVMNALVKVEGPVAYRALASYLRTPVGINFMGPDLTIMLIQLKTPPAELLRILHEQLVAYRAAMGNGPVHADHAPEVGKLLAAAAIASRVVSRGGPGEALHQDGEMMDAADAVEALVVDNFHRASDVDAEWNSVHGAAREQAAKAWEGKSHGFKEYYAKAAHPMPRRALEWEVAQFEADGSEGGSDRKGSGYRTMMQKAKEHFIREHLEVRASITPHFDANSVHTVSTTMRAVRNLKARGRALTSKVVACLDHRSDTVQAEATKTLAAIGHQDDVERHLLRKIESQLSNGDAAHRQFPKVTNASLTALASNRRGLLSVSGVQHVVRLLLQRNLHLATEPNHVGKSPFAICKLTCEAKCNPFLMERCGRECDQECKAELQTFEAMRTAWHRTWHAAPNTREHAVDAVRLHAPTSHPSQLALASMTSMRPDAEFDSSVWSNHSHRGHWSNHSLSGERRRLKFLDWANIDYEKFSTNLFDYEFSHPSIFVDKYAMLL